MKEDERIKWGDCTDFVTKSLLAITNSYSNIGWSVTISKLPNECVVLKNVFVNGVFLNVSYGVVNVKKLSIYEKVLLKEKQCILKSTFMNT